MTMLRRLLPAPWLSLALFVLWLLLARSAAPGQVVLGIALALVVPPLTAGLRIGHARIRRPDRALRFAARVAFDVVASNLAVGRDVLLFRRRRPTAAFVVIPLELHDPVGLAMLALVTTIVPGTVWSELAIDRSTLLLHVWDVDDEAGYVARFKDRYERPLREIFE
ncbi:Na+/H+ antiporter subunit E [Aerolutibacter ruishenii]|uniref:Multisubunit potassium/proton antiporter, PhaE subunit (TC 2.A.63.1.1) n=1 Tax=Aerolutibacter ruishenii TaxID=686800 RepID=A0A562LKQ4_9GAMM|nr:Na+/H+ antiporter subunit E [Lysobacter ruishenii]TWI08208.1 multisubunit potassium/proton antiporter, PhaE subunit (TC 2.A.63.1.1) [Lysobacter ruishenii]